MFSAQSPDQLYQTEQEAIRLSEEIKAEYWAVSAKSGGSSAGAHATSSAPRQPSAPPPIPCDIPGDGVRDFFFRVASLTFEATVLSELETSGLKHVSDIVSESVSTINPPPSHPPVANLTVC